VSATRPFYICYHIYSNSSKSARNLSPGSCLYRAVLFAEYEFGSVLSLVLRIKTRFLVLVSVLQNPWFSVWFSVFTLNKGRIWLMITIYLLDRKVRRKLQRETDNCTCLRVGSLHGNVCADIWKVSDSFFLDSFSSLTRHCLRFSVKPAIATPFRQAALAADISSIIVVLLWLADAVRHR